MKIKPGFLRKQGKLNTRRVGTAHHPPTIRRCDPYQQLQYKDRLKNNLDNIFSFRLHTVRSAIKWANWGVDPEEFSVQS